MTGQTEGKATVIEKLIGSTISGVLGGLSSAIVSVVLAAFLVPMPIDKTHHVVGYGIGGFMCGMLSGFMGVYAYMKREGRGAPRVSRSRPGSGP